MLGSKGREMEKEEEEEREREEETLLCSGVCTGFWPFQLALYKRQATIEAASAWLVAVKEFCSQMLPPPLPLLLLHPPTIRATDGGKSQLQTESESQHMLLNGAFV